MSKTTYLNVPTSFFGYSKILISVSVNRHKRREKTYLSEEKKKKKRREGREVGCGRSSNKEVIFVTLIFCEQFTRVKQEPTILGTKQK